MAGKFPLLFGTDEQFAAVRRYLLAAGYTEQALCERFEVSRLYNLVGGFNRQGKRLEPGLRAVDQISFLVRLFLAGVPVPEPEVERWVPAPERQAMEALGLLLPYDGRPGTRFAPALLCPAESVYLASDRYVGPTGESFYDQDDIVMLPISKVSQDYTDMVARTPCERFLDLGAGAGQAAMYAAAGFARQVWATDITGRAVQFGEFNRRLNGLENVTVVQGDLFAPVAGIQFDRIASNPPFEPPLKQKYIYSVGGSDGEAIVKRILQSLHEVLAPGGRLYCICLGTDREDDLFEARLRRYLGAHSDEFDLAVVIRDMLEPMEYAMEATIGEQEGFDKMARWGEFFASLKAKKVLYGHVVVQRRAAPRPVFTVRRLFGPKSGIRQTDWLLDWMTRTMEGGAKDLLFSARPTAPPRTELRVRHSFRTGKLLPEDYTLWTEHPFQTDLYCPPWMAMLASWCDGTRSGRDLLDRLRTQAGQPDTTEEHFLNALGALVAGGFVEVDGCAPPE